MNKLTAALAAVFVAAGMMLGPAAHADPNVGCETIHWGFLGLQWRTICDGPRRPDGSWERARRIWTPAGFVPGWCSVYFCQPGYYQQEITTGFEQYVVFDSNVLPGEPGWLPPGAFTIR